MTGTEGRTDKLTENEGRTDNGRMTDNVGDTDKERMTEMTIGQTRGT